MPSEEVMLDFSDEEGGLQGKVIWAQDSNGSPMPYRLASV